MPKGRTLSSATTPDAELPDFPDQFRQLFVHLKIHKALRRLASSHPQGPQLPIAADESFSDFGKYDWSRVQVRLVLSIPGQYNGFPKMIASGICRLAKVIEEEGWVPRKGERVEAEYQVSPRSTCFDLQGSSLGGYYIDWFTRFYQSLGGMDLVTMARQPKALSWPPIKVIFPSLATVDASVLGRPVSGAWDVLMIRAAGQCSAASRSRSILSCSMMPTPSLGVCLCIQRWVDGHSQLTADDHRDVCKADIGSRGNR